jgi:hypothetical protein
MVSRAFGASVAVPAALAILAPLGVASVPVAAQTTSCAYATASTPKNNVITLDRAGGAACSFDATQIDPSRSAATPTSATIVLKNGTRVAITFPGGGALQAIDPRTGQAVIVPESLLSAYMAVLTAPKLAPTPVAAAKPSPLLTADLTAAVTTCGQTNTSYARASDRTYQPIRNGAMDPKIHVASGSAILYGCTTQLGDAGWANVTALVAATPAAPAAPLLTADLTVAVTTCGQSDLAYGKPSARQYSAVVGGAMQRGVTVASGSAVQYGCASRFRANGWSSVASFSPATPVVASTTAPQLAASSCSLPETRWPVKNLDTAGFKIADDDGCTYYVVAPSNVHRNGDNTLAFFGHTVRRGTLNFPNGYYFRIPASGVSASALSSGRIDAVAIRGANGTVYVDRDIVHSTNRSGVVALVPVGGSPLFLADAGVIAAGSGNVIAAGSGNVINAGAYNFTQLQTAGVIAAGAHN